VFGWEAEAFGPADAGIMVWRLPGYVGGEPQQPVPRDVVAAMAPGEHPGWLLDFWIDDADAAASMTTRLGGTVLAEPSEAPPFRRAVLADPEGAAFSVSQLKLG
jgi:uncharacterized protein